MTRRTIASYTHVFEYIHNNIFNLNCVSFMADYEAAPRTVLRRMFPNIPILGCWFHLCQAVRRRALRLPIVSNLIRTDITARKIFYKLLAVPLLPKEKIFDGFSSVRKQANEYNNQFDPLFQYFDDQWMVKVKYFSLHLFSFSSSSFSNIFCFLINFF